MKKSYHSIVVPMTVAATIQARAVPGVCAVVESPRGSCERTLFTSCIGSPQAMGVECFFARSADRSFCETRPWHRLFVSPHDPGYSRCCQLTCGYASSNVR